MTPTSEPAAPTRSLTGPLAASMVRSSPPTPLEDMHEMPEAFPRDSDAEPRHFPASSAMFATAANTTAVGAVAAPAAATSTASDTSAVPVASVAGPEPFLGTTCFTKQDIFTTCPSDVHSQLLWESRNKPVPFLVRVVSEPLLLCFGAGCGVVMMACCARPWVLHDPARRTSFAITVMEHLKVCSNPTRALLDAWRSAPSPSKGVMVRVRQPARGHSAEFQGGLWGTPAAAAAAAVVVVVVPSARLVRWCALV